jgi:hypothetical protein
MRAKFVHEADTRIKLWVASQTPGSFNFPRALNLAELTQPWRASNGPATQRLGPACFESGRFSALRYRSTKAAPSHCLAVFPAIWILRSMFLSYDPQEFFSQIQLTSSKEI